MLSSERVAARSTTLASSRMLPGHCQARRSSSASGEKATSLRPSSAANFRRKNSRKTEMSALRSRSGGMRSWITFSR